MDIIEATKEKKSDYKRASSYYLVGTVFNKGIGFITVPIFTRILSVEDYGIVNTYNSWVYILVIIMSLALYMAIRISFVDYQHNTNDFLSVMVVFTCIYGCILSGVIILIIWLLPFSISLSVAVLCLIQAFSLAIIEDVSMYYMMKYRYRIRTAMMVLPNLISTIIAVILIEFVLTDKLYLGRIIPSSVITLCFGVVALIITLKGSNIRFNKEYLQYALKIAVPLVFQGLALNVLSQSDRIMITSIRNASETGVYGLIYNYSMIAVVLTTAFDGIWIPFFNNNMKNRDYRRINAFCRKYVSLVSITMIGVILVGPEIVKVLSTEDYWDGIIIIPPIVLANYVIFVYTMYVNIEHFFKKTVFISVNTMIAAGLNILLNLYFIKKWGYIGAAYTTLISYTISLVLHYRYSKTLSKDLYVNKPFFMPMLYVLVSVAVFYYMIDYWYFRWLTAAFFALVLLLKEKDFIRELIRKS